MRSAYCDRQSWCCWALVGHIRDLWLNGASEVYSCYWTRIGNPSPGIQCYYQPARVTPNVASGPSLLKFEVHLMVLLCLTLSNFVPWQNWMAVYLGYTLRMKTLFCGWPVMVDDTHTRRRRRLWSLVIIIVIIIIAIICQLCDKCQWQSWRIAFAAESFHTFVSLVSEFPSVKEKSQFVFVPGPRDPGPGPILPRYFMCCLNCI